MNKIITLILTLLLITSCTKEKTKFQYKYSNQDDLFKCSTQHEKLIKEAVYTFEDYITKHYTFKNKNTTANGYNGYLKLLFYDRAPASEYFSAHLKEVVKILKEKKDLWIQNGSKTRLNYNNEFVNCLIQSIQDEELKNILSVLTKSNTLKPVVIAPLLFENRKLMTTDKALATYVALDMFYTQLFYMDTPEFKEKRKKPNNSVIYPENLTPIEKIKKKPESKLKN